MSRSKINMVTILKRWGAVAGLVATIGTAIPVVSWGFAWVAHTDARQGVQDDAISDLKKQHDDFDAKIDGIRQDVSEVKGMVKLLVEQRRQEIAVAPAGRIAATPTPIPAPQPRQ